MKKKLMILLLSLSVIGCSAINKITDNIVDSSYPIEDDKAQISPIRDYVEEVNNRFKKAGIDEGEVTLDRKGRLMLKGQYDNESQIDRAFAIAQEMVGVRWVSPVNPSNITVTSWGKCLGQTFSNRISKECQLLFNRNREFISDKNAPNPIVNKYALVVGVSQFKHGENMNEKGQRLNHNLTYPSKDAKDIYQYLVSPSGGGIPRENITLLTDRQVTTMTIENALETIKRKAQEDDLVFIYMSSHGTNPDKNGYSHVVVYDTQLPPKNGKMTSNQRAEYIKKTWDTSFRQEILKNFNQTVKAKRLVNIFDTCYSGAVFRPAKKKDLNQKLAQLQQEDWKYSSGQSSQSLQKNLLGSKDIFIDTPIYRSDSPQTTYLPSTVNWGVVFISASGESELSWEPTPQQRRIYNMNNSIFTHYLLQSLRHTGGNMKKSFKTARPETTSCVRERGQSIIQIPQLFSHQSNANIILGQ